MSNTDEWLAEVFTAENKETLTGGLQAKIDEPTTTVPIKCDDYKNRQHPNATKHSTSQTKSRDYSYAKTYASMSCKDD